MNSPIVVTCWGEQIQLNSFKDIKKYFGNNVAVTLFSMGPGDYYYKDVAIDEEHIDYYKFKSSSLDEKGYLCSEFIMNKYVMPRIRIKICPRSCPNLRSMDGRTCGLDCRIWPKRKKK